MKLLSNNKLPEILFVTSFPPRECGIATYSQDLIKAINDKFENSFSIKVCALETNDETFNYNEKIIYKLNTSISEEYLVIAEKINHNENIQLVIVQHEFGFFNASGGLDFLKFLTHLSKPIILGFHTVLPRPDEKFMNHVKAIVDACKHIIVMTNTSKKVLELDYDIPSEKIEVISHGTHLVLNNNKQFLKEKHKLTGRRIITTFGLMSSGKSIETTLDALPAIIKTNPEVIFLALGKTHPGVIKAEGEKYRQMLEQKVKDLNIQNHVLFVNQYLSLSILLEYLRLTDIYLFTSNDPNQAVSGTFSYAMSCGCPIISTPFPQAREMLNESNGIIIDFKNSQQLSEGVIKLLNNESLRKNMNMNALQKIAPTAWENSAIAHALLIKKTLHNHDELHFSIPSINLNHLNQLTDKFGMFQFSKINQPDAESGYTLDDNSRALIAICMHYQSTSDNSDIALMKIYLNFIKFCSQKDGRFLNYVDKKKQFTAQNFETNLEDSNGRAIWALGYVLSKKSILPSEIINQAKEIMEHSMTNISKIFSSRAMAFCIKGLYYLNLEYPNPSTIKIIETLSERLVSMYKHESEEDWNWFESSLTYANSVISEAMIYAWITLKKLQYLDIAIESFHFLLSKTFSSNEIKVISNKSWLSKGGKQEMFGEQPIDVAYTIMTLNSFYKICKDESYLNKLTIAFNWFLGNNHLHQIIYNPCTGGCYDGLEEFQVNLNQGAESTLSYLMARLTIEQYSVKQKQKLEIQRNILFHKSKKQKNILIEQI